MRGLEPGEAHPKILPRASATIAGVTAQSAIETDLKKSKER